MTRPFADKLAIAQAERSRWALYIEPHLATIPPEIARYDDPFLPYMRAIFAATHDLVCAYVFSFPAYLALGAAGAIALERSIALAVATHITIIDGQFASEAYVSVWDDGAFAADAMTFAPGNVTTGIARSDRQAFVVSDHESGGARYEPSRRTFMLPNAEIALLPADTLFRARSLDFEQALRRVVASYVRA